MEIVNKGWGYEKIIVNKPEYCGKILHIKKNFKNSWHYHLLKDETFFLQAGTVLLLYSENDDIELADQIVLSPGDSYHIYRGLRHRLIAYEDSDIFEFSTEFFEEDSIRLIKGD